MLETACPEQPLPQAAPHPQQASTRSGRKPSSMAPQCTICRRCYHAELSTSHAGSEINLYAIGNNNNNNALCRGCSVVSSQPITGSISCVMGADGSVIGIVHATGTVCASVGASIVVKQFLGAITSVTAIPSRGLRTSTLRNRGVASLHFSTSSGETFSCGTGAPTWGARSYSMR